MASLTVGVAHSMTREARSRLQATTTAAAAVMVTAAVECGLQGSSSSSR